MLTVDNRLSLLTKPVKPEALQLEIEIYRQMATIRKVEQKLLDLYGLGFLSGTIHTSMGQEACDVGIIHALDRSKDVIFSNHRAHGQYIAYSDDIEGLIAEIMGKETGVCKGIGGSQHIHIRNMYTNGVQGGIVPNAVGAALAEKLKGSDAIVVVFLGDGTMGEGVVYESLNMASLWSLPILFVLEDNGIAQSTPKQFEHAGDLATRAISFEIAHTSLQAVDGTAVYETVCEIVADIRTHSVPFFLHAQTMRLGPHSKGDDTRPKEAIDFLRKMDPVDRLSSLIPTALRQAMDQKIDARVQAAVDQAIAAAYPSMKILRGNRRDGQYLR
ncbi:MAG TPA: thiamine pyrophosphate-dependent dehydrogenase E1 component subunit alpha [Anaerolineaceae bacterium]|nr:thiamine pyrophosphate-dependent dehydrogenase E1 component subunit alpha [Anaerolineaceae bacterium]